MDEENPNSSIRGVFGVLVVVAGVFFLLLLLHPLRSVDDVVGVVTRGSGENMFKEERIMSRFFV